MYVHDIAILLNLSEFHQMLHESAQLQQTWKEDILECFTV